MRESACKIVRQAVTSSAPIVQNCSISSTARARSLASQSRTLRWPCSWNPLCRPPIPANSPAKANCFVECRREPGTGPINSMSDVVGLSGLSMLDLKYISYRWTDGERCLRLGLARRRTYLEENPRSTIGGTVAIDRQRRLTTAFRNDDRLTQRRQLGALPTGGFGADSRPSASRCASS